MVVAGDDNVDGNERAPRRNSKKIVLPPEFRKEFKIEDMPEEVAVDTQDRDERLPPFDLLANSKGL